MDSDNTWSSPQTFFFLRPHEFGRNTLTSYEWWFDNDYSSRKSNAFSSGKLNADIKADGLTPGLHHITFRFSDIRGKWSAPQTSWFLVPHPKGDERISAYSYWFNSAASDAVTVKLENPSMPLVLEKTVSTENLLTSITPDNFTLAKSERGMMKPALKNVFHTRYQTVDGLWCETTADTFAVVIEEPVIDLTGFIANPMANDKFNGWKTNLSNSIQGNTPWTPASTKYFCTTAGTDDWNTAMSQTLPPLPPGAYLLSAVGRCAEDVDMVLSVNGYDTQFPAVGTIGGEIWANAQEGSDEKNANSGNGSGWARREIVFVSDGTPVTIQLKGKANGDDKWMHIDDFTLTYNNETNSSLTVNLPPDADMEKYSNMNIVLSSPSSKINLTTTKALSYSFYGLSEGSGYSVEMRNRYGQQVTLLPDIVLAEGENIITLPSLQPLADATCAIITPDGDDVSSVSEIVWKTSDGNLIPYSSKVSGLVRGGELLVSVNLPDSLGVKYHEISDRKIELSEDVNNLTITLDSIESSVLTGRILSDRGAVSGATLSLSQMVNGKHLVNYKAVSDDKGKFAVEVLRDSVNIIVSDYGYFDFKTDTVCAEEIITLDDIRLQLVKGVIVYTDNKYKKCGKEVSGNRPITKYTDYANFGYSLFNTTTNTKINDFKMVGSNIVIVSGVKAGDMVKATAHSLNKEFADTVSSFTICEGDSARVMFDLVELGGVTAGYLSAGNDEVIATLYDDSGKFIKTAGYFGGYCTFSHLPEGNYSLLSMGRTMMVNSPTNMAVLDNAGLVEGKDYLLSHFVVEDGVMKELQYDAIPFIDETLYYYTGDGTRFSGNKTKLTIGNYLTLTAAVDFKREFAGKVSNPTLLIDLPEGCAYVDGSAIAGANITPCAITGNRLTLPLELDKLNRQIRLCLIPKRTGDMLASAYVSFEIDGESVIQPIGNASFTAEELSFLAPEMTRQPVVNLSGMGVPYAKVTIYDGVSPIAVTTVSASGSWMVSAELDNPYNLSEHPLSCRLFTKDGIELTTSTKVVVYNRDYNAIKKVTMVNTAHMSSSLNTVEYITVFDFENPSSEAPVYWYWPSYRTFTFFADFYDNSPEIVSNVSLMVHCSDGNSVKVPLKYDENHDLWIGNRDFTSSSLPVNVEVLADIYSKEKVDLDYMWEQVTAPDKAADEYEEICKRTDELMIRLDKILDNSDGFDVSDPELNDILTELDKLGDDTDTEITEELKKDEKYNTLLSNVILSESKEERDKTKKELDDYIATKIPDTGFSLPDPDVFKSNVNNIPETDGGVSISITDTQLPSGTPSGDNEMTIPTGNDKLPIHLSLGENGKVDIIIPDPSNNGKGKKISMTPQDKFRFDSSKPDYASNEQWPEMISTMSDLSPFIDISLESVEPLIQSTLNSAIIEKNYALSQLAYYKDVGVEPYPNYVKDAFRNYGKSSATIAKYNKYGKNFKGIGRWGKGVGMFGDLFGVVDTYKNWEGHSVNMTDMIGFAYQCGTATTTPEELEKKLNKAIINNNVINISRCALNTGSAVATAATLTAAPATGGLSLLGTILVEVTKFVVDKTLESLSDYNAKSTMKVAINAIDWDACGLPRPDENGRFFYPGADAKFVQDPSGFVYEAVSSNRLEGVTASIYEKKISYDMYGDRHDDIVLWDAAPFAQKNPQITDKFGVYAWDVPMGEWQVKFEKEGYETTYTDWLPVPPPQLDINVPMTQSVQPEIEETKGYPSGVKFRFSKFMRPASLSGDSVVTVIKDGEYIPGNIVMLNLEKEPLGGKEYASILKFVPTVAGCLNIGDIVTIRIRKDAKSYVGVNLGKDFECNVQIEPEITDIVSQEEYIIEYGDSISIDVSLLPAEAADGAFVRIANSSPSIISVDKGAGKVSDKGTLNFKVFGKLPGLGIIILSVDGYDIYTELKVKVVDENTSVAPPEASIPTGTDVDSGTAVALTTSTEGARIYYTLDGTCPCNPETRILYTDPIIVKSSMIIKAYAVKEGLEDSEVVTFSYGVSGIGEISADSGLEVYPLPLGETLNIKSSDKKIDLVEICNLDGRVMTYWRESSDELITLYTGDFPPGYYVITIMTGNNVISRKIMKLD